MMGGTGQETDSVWPNEPWAKTTNTDAKSTLSAESSPQEI